MWKSDIKYPKQSILDISRESCAVYTWTRRIELSWEHRFQLNITMFSHEEADTRLTLHAYHMAQNGIRTITVRTADNDVVVIFVHIFH